MNKYNLDRVLYDAFVCAARDAITDNTICRLAVTEEANGFGIWVAVTCVEDTPDDRTFTWRFSEMFYEREDAIEDAVKRVNQARAALSK